MDEEQISYMDQRRHRLQLVLEDADEERIMMEEDAMAAAEVAAMVAAENDVRRMKNNNDDIEGEEYSMQILLELVNYRN